MLERAEAERFLEERGFPVSKIVLSDHIPARAQIAGAVIPGHESFDAAYRNTTGQIYLNLRQLSDPKVGWQGVLVHELFHAKQNLVWRSNGLSLLHADEPWPKVLKTSLVQHAILEAVIMGQELRGRYAKPDGMMKDDAPPWVNAYAFEYVLGALRGEALPAVAFTELTAEAARWDYENVWDRARWPAIAESVDTITAAYTKLGGSLK